MISSLPLRLAMLELAVEHQRDRVVPTSRTICAFHCGFRRCSGVHERRVSRNSRVARKVSPAGLHLRPALFSGSREWDSLRVRVRIPIDRVPNSRCLVFRLPRLRISSSGQRANRLDHLRDAHFWIVDHSGHSPVLSRRITRHTPMTEAIADLTAAMW